MNVDIVYFCSSNTEKHADVAHVFAGSRSPPRPLVRPLVEPLSSDLDVVIREKAMAAYRKALVPLFVEHSGLYFDHLHGLPGPLVKLFWEKLEGDICALVPPGARRGAHVLTKVCYCDGKRLRVYEGHVEGSIAAARRGAGGIHWDPVFIPSGHDLTFGEMSRAERLRFGASAQAFAGLRDDLKL